jgi:ATP-binding cassette, subfamily F, member 3
MLQIANLTIHFGARTLFENITFTIQPKDRIGLTGKNGAGKSTLLKAINGEVTFDGGSITKPQYYSIGFLKQEIRSQNQPTVFEEAKLAFAEINALQANLDKLQHELETRTDYETESYLNLSQEFCDLNDRLSHMDADNMDKEIELVLQGLGYKREDFTKSPSTFSGGWAMRLELAKILLQRPDLILLDEPTNHLDIESILWLENFLKNYEGAIVLVSHDRTFLDNVTNKTIELELGKMYEYKANYSKYLTLREERREKQTATYKNQQDQIKQIERNIERFKAKASKASFAQSLVKKLDKMDIVEIDEVDAKSMKFQFPIGKQSGKVVVEAKKVSKSYGDKKVLEDVNFEIERGEKIAFIGKNGMGKTTMARMIVNEIGHNGGELKLGYNVEIAFFAQHHAENLPKQLTVFQSMDDMAQGEVRMQLRNILGAFMFSGEDVDKKISVLSGGERARLCLAQLLLKPSNLLILDEPTNHLDIRSKEVLKESIKKYAGTVIIVSHDRDFLTGLTDKVFEFKDGHVKQYFGDVNDFFEARKLEDFRSLEASDEGRVTKAEKKQNNDTRPSTPDTSKDQKKNKNQILKLEEQIALKEQEIKNLESKIDQDNSNNKFIQEDFTALEQLKKSLDELMEAWEELQV